MTKILALSDRVVEKIYSPAITHKFSDVDLVLSCGDLPFYYLEYVISKLDVPLLYVLGNHDQGIHTSDGLFEATPMGGINLDGRVTEARGLLIAGLEGSIRYSGRGKYQYTEGDMCWKALRLFPALWANRVRYGRFLDILVTHAPPFHIHNGSDLCHTGFKTFRWLMERFRPRYLIHGHQHIYSPDTAFRTTYQQTEVINAYGYQIIEWGKEQR